MPNPERIDELMKLWEKARVQGQNPSIETLCPDDAALAEELRERIRRTFPGFPPSETDFATNATLLVPTQKDETRPVPGLVLRTDLEVVRLHAKGGLGLVYLGTDTQLHRDVAIKVVKPMEGDFLERRRELLREAEITGKLEHPGVVSVYGIGHREDGEPFYVMRFIQGESLNVAIERHYASLRESKRVAVGERTMEFRTLLTRFISVCYTVAYAHNRGIIHRDIKPDNIMLGKYGETLLVDWGLAMPVDRDPLARASGEKTLLLKSPSQSGNSSGVPIGTPSYMSPEQASAMEPLTPSTDVYSLGGTLYKLISGEMPYQGMDVHEVCRRVRNGEFLKPSMVCPHLSRDLEAICLKAMALRPKDRYASPLELASDLERWLADEPTSVRQESAFSRLGRWTRRYRGTALATAFGLLVSFLIAIVAAVWLGRMAGHERHARHTGLKFAAKFAARMLASEMDLRWRVLESEASDPQLHMLLSDANQNPGDKARWKPLQDWLNQKFIDHQKSATSSSWFLDDRQGTLIALSGVAPERAAKYLGKNYVYRDYFHGLGKDFDPDTKPGSIEPISKAYRSAVFLSQSDQKLKVAFTVPIRKERVPGGEVLGVLAMTVDLGAFATLQTQLGPEERAVLVDTRADYTEKVEKRGLIVHHPNLHEGQTETFRIDDQLLERFVKLRKARSRVIDGESKSGERKPQTDGFEEAFIDPTAPTQQWMAAFEPILVNGRPEETRDTGWIVIVQGKK